MSWRNFKKVHGVSKIVKSQFIPNILTNRLLIWSIKSTDASNVSKVLGFYFFIIITEHEASLLNRHFLNFSTKL